MDKDFHKRKNKKIKEETNEDSIISKRKIPRAKNSIDLESTMKSLVAKEKYKTASSRQSSSINPRSHFNPESNNQTTSSFSQKSSTSSDTGGSSPISSPSATSSQSSSHSS